MFLFFSHAKAQITGFDGVSQNILKIYHQSAFKLLSILQVGDEAVAHTLLSTVIMEQNFFP